MQQHFFEERPEAKLPLDLYFQNHVLQQMQAEQISAARIGDYQTYVRRWAQCWAEMEKEHRTITPVLYLINPRDLAIFQKWVQARFGLSNSQTNKHTTGISSLLRRAEQDWVIGRVPTIKNLPSGGSVGTLFVFTADEFDQLFEAAEQAAWPSKTIAGQYVDASLYWQTFLVGGWNYGFRAQEWWAVKRTVKHTLQWDGVCFEPKMKIHGREMTSKHGWLSWRQQKTGREMVLPMNQAVSNWMRLLGDHTAGSGARVFDSPYNTGTAKGTQRVTPASGFYACWWDIVERAGIRPAVDAKGNHSTHCPKHFRKTARTLHQNLWGGDGTIANWITGHAGSGNVGDRNYYNAMDKVIDSLARIEQPESFTRFLQDR